MARAKQLPLTAAYSFAAKRDLGEKAERIRNLDTRELTKPSMPRRGYFVDLFRANGILDEFIAEHWPDGGSSAGESMIARYAEYKASFEAGGGTEAEISQGHADRLVDLVRRTYPGWSGFSHPRFEADEVHYKREVVEAASERLSESALQDLLDAGEYDEFVQRLDAIGKQTNLMFLSIPSSGDLNLIYREDLPKESFCRAIFDLIHGEGEGPARLGRYLGWIAEHDIPRSHNKWTFPTYLLFFCHPEDEMFVKPSIVRKFFGLVGLDVKLGSPSGDVYATIRNAYDELGDLLDEYSPRDMVDLQGFVWVAVRAHEQAESEATPMAETRREFEALRGSVPFQCRLRSRHYRAPEIQALLANPESLTADLFNKEVWRRISSVELEGRDVTDLFNRDISDVEAEMLLAAMEDGTLSIHGNNIWGSGSHVYGSMLRLSADSGSILENVVEVLEEAGGRLSRSDLLSRVAEATDHEEFGEPALDELIRDHSPYLSAHDDSVERVPEDRVREGYIREAAAVLHDGSLDPAQKAERLMDLPGFGRNTSTGLVMLFHPDEYGLYNQLSRGVLERLGLPARDIDEFQDSLATLKEELGAGDHFELDLFLTALDDDAREQTRTSPRCWWVNQGMTYEEERDLECVWAPTPEESGQKLGHHMAVAELRRGDRILHYHDGMLRAVGRVTEQAIERPKSAPDGEGPVGFYADVEYSEIEPPIDPAEVPEDWRRSEEGPFNRLGGVKQGYLFPLSETFVDRMRGRFDVLADLLPAADRHAWLFQANPKYFDLQDALRAVQPGDVDNWSVYRYGDEMREGDYLYLWQSGDNAGVYATGRISGAVFEGTAGAWAGDEQGEAEPRIPFKYDCVLESPIHRTEILDDPTLSQMQVVRAPQGTNFRIMPAEHARLQELIGGTRRKIEFEEIVRRVKHGGMRISEDVLRRYHLALETRGFVILAGLSGSGKTWLTQLYARAIGARFKLIPVAPNWTTNEDLLGYFNPITQQYHDTAFSRFLRDAAAEYERAIKAGEDSVPFHLALDEMNLARVEYYFARFLSAMEVRARGETATIELGPEDTVALPPNLYFIGTVNIDETTHGFADKVYDRAQLIELQAPRPMIVEHLGDLNYAPKLLEIYDAVEAVAPFAFRVLDEIEAYVTAAEEYGVSWQSALDEQVVQKVLPKLKGADPRIGMALEAVMAVSEGSMPLTNAKAKSMADTLRDYGFTSYF